MEIRRQPKDVPWVHDVGLWVGIRGGGTKVGMGRVGSSLGSGPKKGKEGVIGGIEVRGVGLGVDHGKGMGKMQGTQILLWKEVAP